MTTYTITEAQRQRLMELSNAEGDTGAINILRNLQPNTQKPVGWLIDGLDVVMSHTRAQAEQVEHHAMGGTAVAYPIYTHPAPQQPAEVVALQAKLSAAEARERQTRATLHKFMANQQQPLTDEQILELWKETYVVRGTSGIEFARAIEAAHGVKP